MASSTLLALNDNLSATAQGQALITAQGGGGGNIVFEIFDGTNWELTVGQPLDGLGEFETGRTLRPSSPALAWLVQTGGAVNVRVRASTSFNGTAVNVTLVTIASGGGGGGGAVTIADGLNLTQGAKADAPATTGDVTPWSVIALLKGVWNKLAGWTSAAPLPVTLATDLTFANDTVGAVPQAAATGGASVKRIISANSTNGTLVKASAGNLYSVRIANLDTTAAAYVKLYNEITNPPVVGTDTVFDTFPCPAAVSATQPSIVIFSGPSVGVFLSTGIGVGVTQLLADSDTTAVGANKVLVTLIYN